MKTKAKPKKHIKHYIIANGNYGLYYGEVVRHDLKTATVTAKNCRHIARWFGGTGGITSLAHWGPKDPTTGSEKNRIGAPCDAVLTNIVNLFECTEEADKAFAAIVPTAP